jgi:ParB-like chromosome segregation protein Spo0J
MKKKSKSKAKKTSTTATNKNGAMKIKLSEITRPDYTQVRERLDREAIATYAETMRNGEKFPPIDLVEVDGKLILAHGFHRFDAAKLAGLTAIDAMVRTGTKADALRIAVGANARNGVALTRADKRKAVRLVLDDPELKCSQRQIAKLCGVSHRLVQLIVNELKEAAKDERGGKIASAAAQHKGTKHERDDDDQHDDDETEDTADDAESDGNDKAEVPDDQDDDSDEVEVSDSEDGDDEEETGLGDQDEDEGDHDGAAHEDRDEPDHAAETAHSNGGWAGLPTNAFASVADQLVAFLVPWARTIRTSPTEIQGREAITCARTLLSGTADLISLISQVGGAKQIQRSIASLIKKLEIDTHSNGHQNESVHP